MLDRIRKYLKLKKMLNKEQKFVSRYPEYVEKDAVVFKKIDENYEFLKKHLQGKQ